MAAIIPFMLIDSKRRSCSLVSLLTISLLLMNGYALEARKFVESNYRTFEISTLRSSSSCKASNQGPSKGASLKVINRHGPCSKLGHEGTYTPTLAQVLEQDQIRVQSIQKRARFNVKMDEISDTKTDIPARSAITIGSLNYVVTIGLGTPMKSLTLAFDTGSHLTWTQCQPCSGSCYAQQDPIFDPAASSSYSNISCNSPQCSQLSTATRYPPRCATSTCVYQTKYGDGSISVGNFGNETLTLTPNDVFHNFLFGCGQNNQGLFGKTAGILGLGTDPLSVVSQTAQQYEKYFSYCLPTQVGSDGHLTFGNTAEVSNNLAFTPFASNKLELYFVTMVAISVGGQQLPIDPNLFQQGGNIIDSGTVITNLAPTAYAALRDAFKQQMSQYPSAPASQMFDTCYDFTNYPTVKFPVISIFFEGNVKVDLGFLQIFLEVSQSQFCLAFVANNADTDLGIYGNVQQQTFEVAYDVAGGRLGFRPGGCT